MIFSPFDLPGEAYAAFLSAVKTRFMSEHSHLQNHKLVKEILLFSYSFKIIADTIKSGLYASVLINKRMIDVSKQRKPIECLPRPTFRTFRS